MNVGREGWDVTVEIKNGDYPNRESGSGMFGWTQLVGGISYNAIYYIMQMNDESWHDKLYDRPPS